MELRYLRYFVAVATARHFTRAAENLGISQPPLSQQIKKLEHEIGTPLFKRLTRGVEMTEAGEALYTDACQLLKLSDAAIDRARSIARGEEGSFNIGFSSSSSFHPAVLRLLNAYRQRYPNVSLSPREENPPLLLTELHNRNLDIAFLRLPCNIGSEFNSEVLAEESMELVLPADHPLHNKQSVHLNELKREPLIMSPREVCPGLHDMILRTCYLSGYQPTLSQPAPQLPATIGMVSAGFGITIIPQSLSCIKMANVSYHAIKDSQLSTQIIMVWRQHERSPIIMNMVKLLRHHLRAS
ncbi:MULTISPECIES: LysR family transcriptional regulator [unclassified Brenneria]|uniref:LysR family transcriptional regulator n=1 Tax=unclassified Brenneria TaxID=2634434 RepID=UPI0015552833|nr:MULTISPECIES: LysR family transcriptional regulator [unclassified Brenneria]MBJ7222636.1 LysR family transcriptional regulator [Brenneria sp. L3-3C-1]MEE3643879.1 LysR family transcriptional regulator [Brenneria sp. L3_3C_1]MEE3651168.1 LysR family transcriptional regulator [Brenneria sp. HEZEL_4_2_4]NPD01123.1 LysR family transcriptional regulator [Brenneria sp. hezel4-2-4]